ncbi:hypothetical protein M107_1753 [Bacteroides fragilis str. 3725 D9(v)]|jgi:hypothetical protein|uniref:Uncharacterized protein n=1 Tax=Bacteroides fragilis (strain YCH46) TaxID=295405 RepID=Q64UN1_BACFR|nr:hypothetical protein AE940_06430 [Bacteroides fragilis]EXZ64192.1 hypothetical protein M107_1753 [Bacteroides fragilis str. 3725 D9(v)]BAD48798.1 hypothetical protein BF2051 [Bacteroides fragilis YCH46]MBD9185761.1 hypothetical protein [Bacteroides fragilis]RGJ19797.1 hypothetical protein DXD74_01015 [Bacteroides fragilis]
MIFCIVLFFRDKIYFIFFLRTYEGIPKRAIELEFSSFRNSYKSEEHNKFQELVKKYGFYPELCDTCRKGNLLKIKSKGGFISHSVGHDPRFAYKTVFRL